jgi:hypothetical protein
MYTGARSKRVCQILDGFSLLASCILSSTSLGNRFVSGVEKGRHLLMWWGPNGRSQQTTTGLYTSEVRFHANPLRQSHKHFNPQVLRVELSLRYG